MGTPTRKPRGEHNQLGAGPSLWAAGGANRSAPPTAARPCRETRGRIPRPETAWPPPSVPRARCGTAQEKQLLRRRPLGTKAEPCREAAKTARNSGCRCRAMHAGQRIGNSSTLSTFITLTHRHQRYRVVKAAGSQLYLPCRGGDGDPGWGFVLFSTVPGSRAALWAGEKLPEIVIKRNNKNIIS